MGERQDDERDQRHAHEDEPAASGRASPLVASGPGAGAARGSARAAAPAASPAAATTAPAARRAPRGATARQRRGDRGRACLPPILAVRQRTPHPSLPLEGGKGSSLILPPPLSGRVREGGGSQAHHFSDYLRRGCASAP